MKKLAVGVGLVVAVVAFCFFNSRPALADGNVGVNWSTPWGGEWMTPGTCGANNLILQTSGSNCTVVASTNVTVAGNLTVTSGSVTASSVTVAPILLSQAVIAASTPTFTGQIILCANCTKQNSGITGGMLCISTGTTGANQWVAVSSQPALTGCL